MRTVLHTEASPGFGGQEIRILAECTGLARRGWRVLLACRPGARVLARAREEGVEVRPIRMRGPADPVALVELVRLLSRERVDLVHTHSSIDAWLGGLAARILRRPVVRSRHVSIPVRRRFNPVYTLLADRVIASGRGVEAALVAAGVPPARIVSLPAGVDLASFSPAVSGETVRKELGLGWPTIGCVAFFRASKGHLHLLEAFRSLLPDYPEARLLLVGDGSGRGEVEAAVDRLGLRPRVLLLGLRRDVPECLAAMDCVVLASLRSEGIPQALLQAMAMERPVVATAAGGIAEVVEDGVTGLLASPGDPAGLARAIRRALEETGASRERAARARALVVSRYSSEAILDRVEALYRALLRP